MAEVSVIRMPAESQYLEGLKAGLFERLETEMGFRKPPHYRIPNLGEGVEKDGVEIRTNETVVGIEVLVVLPMNVREDSFFKKTASDGLIYMIGKTHIYIRTPNDLDRNLEAIKQIAQQGLSIVFFNKARMFDMQWRPEDSENPESQTTNQKPKKSLTVKEAALLGTVFGGAIGAISGWENAKEFTDYLAAHDIVQINETIRLAIQKYAEMEINAFGPISKLFWRTTFAMLAGSVGNISFATIAKITELYEKARKK